MITKDELVKFAFDVLGDLMPSNAYSIEESRPNRWSVFVNRPALMSAPKEVVRDDWKRAIFGTKFENVGLFIAI